MMRRRWLGESMVLLTALATLSWLGHRATATTTRLLLDSQPGDYIGMGQQRRFQLTHDRFRITADGPSGLTVTVDPPRGLGWTLSFAGPNQTRVAPGTYRDARRCPFADRHAGLEVCGEGRGSNELTGWFRVLELTRADDGHVLSLAVDFEQHSEKPQAPALTGQLRYHSTWR